MAIVDALTFHKKVVQLYKAGQILESIECARSALGIYHKYQPLIETYRKIGQSIGDISLMLDAASYYERAGRDPIYAIELTLFADQIYCDWANRSCILEYLARRYEPDFSYRGINMSLLAAIDDPKLHHAVAQCYTNFIIDKMGHNLRRMKKHARRGRAESGKIRIGYVSCDFCAHPMARVIVDIIKHHDRDEFEIFGYDYSPEDGSPERQSVRQVFENFRIFKQQDFLACADLVTSDDIDVLIDLKGYTRDACPEIFSLRPAPIQVSFLGYPGSLAAPWIDYVIADRNVIPQEERHHWTEAMAFMPNSYYPITPLQNSTGVDLRAKRTNYGLPEGSKFVFGCFNNPFKITPEIFRLWMKILEQAPDSVIWLYNRMEISRQNLRKKASAYNIDPGRLIFCENLRHDQHLSRYKYMDLCLDTTPYNAHTTATDALCSGVPVLTLPGRSFASRVGLSLLRKFDLDALIAQGPDDYVHKAVDLAHNPEKAREIKARLERAVQGQSLSMTITYTRDLEKLFSRMVRAHDNGRSGCDLMEMDD